jgi:hypothetical protein
MAAVETVRDPIDTAGLSNCFGLDFLLPPRRRIETKPRQ